MAFGLGCYFTVGEGLSQKPPMSVLLSSETAVINTVAKSNLLPCPLQSMGARIMGFHVVSRDSTDHRHPHGLQHHARTTTELRVVSGSSTDQGHQ